MAWNPDQAYPITLGGSILGSEGPEHWTLRYDFKPASAAETGQGSLTVDHATQRVSFQRPSSVEGCPSLQFNGKYEPSKDGMDCVAIFDGQGFRLEFVQAAVKNLRYQPVIVRAQTPVLAPAGMAAPAGPHPGSGIPSPPVQSGTGARASDEEADELLHSLEEELMSELTGPSLATEESLDGVSFNTTAIGPGSHAVPIPGGRAMEHPAAGRPGDQLHARPMPVITSPVGGTGNHTTVLVPASTSGPGALGPGWGGAKKRGRQASATPPPDLEGLNDLDREFFGGLSPVSSDNSLESGSDEDGGAASSGGAPPLEKRPGQAMDWTDDGAEEL